MFREVGSGSRFGSEGFWFNILRNGLGEQKAMLLN
jgi:hypothetical protein